MWRASPSSSETSSVPGGGRSIVWRDTLQPLKQEVKLHGVVPAGRVIAALEALVTQPNSTAVKGHEVSEDLAFLAQQLLHTSQFQGHSDGRGEVLFCRLVASALHSRRVLMQPAAANIVCSTLRQWADNSGGEGADDASGDRQLQVEALHALAALLQDNLTQVASHEQTAVLALLHALAQGCTSPSTSPSGRVGRPLPSQPMEVQRQALAALAACFPGRTKGAAAAPPLPPDHAAQALLSAVRVLGAATGGGRPAEDNATSKLLTTLVRTLNSMVMASDRAWVPHTGAIVDGLSCLMPYGLLPPGPKSTTAVHPTTAVQPTMVVQPTAVVQRGPPSPQSAPAASTPTAGETTKGRYMPPHLRSGAAPAAASAAATAAAAAAAGAVQQALRVPRPGPASAAPMSSSRRQSDRGSDGEEGGDGGSAAGVQDRFKSSRVRLGLLQCLQSMAKADSRALHQHWTTLMGTQEPKPLGNTLAAMMLYDSVAKVRSMAAATMACLLEGPPQRAFLAVAEARAMPQQPLPQQQQRQPAPPPRGFTTLSSSLGQMVLALHRGLLQAALHDPSMAVVQVALRTLCCLVSGAPYDRLPQGLLPSLLEGLRSCWSQHQQQLSASGAASPQGTWRPAPLLLPQDFAAAPGSDWLSVQAACLACLAEGLSTKAPVAGLTEHLRREMQQLPPLPGGGSSLLPLVTDLLACCSSRHALVRVEALAALRGMASNYTFALDPAATAGEGGGLCWDGVLAAARLSLESSAAAGSPGRPVASPRRSFGGGAAAAAPAGDASASASASTSPEDKAAQHAVQLLAASLRSQAALLGLRVEAEADMGGEAPEAAPAPGASPGPCAAALAALAGRWQQAHALLVPLASGSNSYMVRAAALAALAALPEPAAALLPAALRHALLALLTAAARADAAAAARSTACKVLGVLLPQPWVLLPSQPHDPDSAGSGAPALQAVDALGHALGDGMLSVRISAAWSLANVCEALKRAYLQPLPGQVDQQGGTLPGPSAAAACSGGGGWHVQLLEPLFAHTLLAARDVDKVRWNGVRALGGLLAFVGPGLPAGVGAAELAGWLDRGLPCLQSCLTTGNMKVQWSACAAAQGLLLNTALVLGGGGGGEGTAAAAGRLAPLLLLLVMLVRDSANFKIRTHAATALAAPRARWVFGDAYADTLLVVCGALEGLDGKADEPAAGPSGREGAGGGCPRPNGPAEGAGPGAADAAFPNYRYLPGLRLQLSTTLLQLLSLVQEADGARLWDALVRRADGLRRALLAAAEAAVSASELWGLVAADAQGDEQLGQRAMEGGQKAEGWAEERVVSQLPVDPFELREEGCIPVPSELGSFFKAAFRRGLEVARVRAAAASSQGAGSRREAGFEGCQGGASEGGGLQGLGELEVVLAAIGGVERLVQGGQKKSAGGAQRNGHGSGLAALVEVAQLEGPLKEWASLSAASLM